MIRSKGFKHPWDSSRYSGDLFSLRKEINIWGTQCLSRQSINFLVVVQPNISLKFPHFYLKANFLQNISSYEYTYFEASVLYHLLIYWHQIAMNVNASNNLHRTLSTLVSFPVTSVWLSFHRMFLELQNTAHALSEGIYMKLSLTEAI